MYIQPNQNNVNMYGSAKKPNFWKRLKQKAMDALPERTFNDNPKRVDKWRKFDERLSRPAENRLIMGATAILTQPTIDYYNHKVDQETREVSRCRTIAKIIAGTIVGISVRGSCYSLVKKMTNIKGKSSFSKALLPSKNLKDLIMIPDFLKNYRNALATGVAILAMCVTNFAIDAPLTVYLTNHFNEKRKEKQANEKERGIVNE